MHVRQELPVHKDLSSDVLDSFRRDRAKGPNADLDLTLRPAFRALLAKLGDPQTKLPPVFHVAGTNGKGSTCAFLRAMLEGAGHRVHVYTSPHLVRFHERIRIAGKLIEEDELVELLTQCRDLAAPNSITYFEAATAAAFTAFARHPADFAIVEVGLGGRLDATNILANPIASLITRLSFDHRDYLGESLTAIAREKAGIMREGVPCFAAAQPDHDALAALREAAVKSKTLLSVAGEDWQVTKISQGFRYRDKDHTLDLPAPALSGDHQFDNAALAIAALLNVPDVPSAITKGLRSVEWPARLQRLTQGALTKFMPHESELWLDGGHNDSAGEVLARQAQGWNDHGAMPLHLVCGMLTSKHPAEFLKPLRGFIASMQTVAIPDEAGSFTAQDLAIYAHAAGVEKVSAAAGVREAIKDIVSEAGSPQRILVCGSLYLAGHALRVNEGGD